MIYVLIVTSIVVVLTGGLLADSAASIRGTAHHAIGVHVQALFPRVVETVRSRLANDVYAQLTGTTHRTGPGVEWQGGIAVGSVTLCDDQNDPTCALTLAVSAQLAGCSGLSTQGQAAEIVDSTNVNAAPYVADEQRCAIQVRYAVHAAYAVAAPSGTYAMGQAGVFASGERRLTFRIFGASPYAVLVGVNRDRDFAPDQNPDTMADAAGNGTMDQRTTYDPGNPGAFTDTMVHGVVAEQHRPGPACTEGKTWGVQGGNAIELDGGCNDSVPAPAVLPNGPYDYPATTQWASNPNAARW